MPPRILFLHHTAAIGGAELHLLSVAREYRATSAVVLFSDGPFRAELENAGVEVILIPTPWATAGVRLGAPQMTVRAAASVLRLSCRTARLARNHQLIYANSPKALIVAAAAGFLSRRPVLWFLHDLLDPAHFNARAVRQSVRIANRFSARVLANSSATAAAFIRSGGDRSLVEVVHYGFAPPPTVTIDRADARRGLPVAGVPLIGVFGRLTFWKGQHVVLEALARLPGVHALLVGDECEDADYVRGLRARIEELDLSDRVSFLGFRADVANLLAAVDVVVHASVAPEPFGRVIVEGMLAKRPVIAARAGGVPEIIDDGVSGVLVEPDDPTDLANEIAALLGDPARAAEIAETGRARARERFSVTRMLRSIDRHVSEIARP